MPDMPVAAITPLTRSYQFMRGPIPCGWMGVLVLLVLHCKLTIRNGWKFVRQVLPPSPAGRGRGGERPRETSLKFATTTALSSALPRGFAPPLIRPRWGGGFTGALRVSSVRGATLALMLGLSLFTPQAHAEPKLPVFQGRITDEAGLLKPEDREAIEAQLKSLEETSTDQVAVVTVNSLQGETIEDMGLALGRQWGIGQKDKDNGVVLVIAPNERKVRIEVGRRLEPQLTDALSKIIIENGILPAFRRGDFSGGIRAGVRDINDVLLGDEEAVKDRAKGGLPGQGPDYEALIILAIWIAIFAFIMYQQYKQASQLPQDMRNQRRRGRFGNNGGVIVIPGDSGGWSGGSGGGGGWSGGGGDFGGGGSSGSW